MLNKHPADELQPGPAVQKPHAAFDQRFPSHLNVLWSLRVFLMRGLDMILTPPLTRASKSERLPLACCNDVYAKGTSLFVNLCEKLINLFSFGLHIKIHPIYSAFAVCTGTVQNSPWTLLFDPHTSLVMCEHCYPVYRGETEAPRSEGVCARSPQCASVAGVRFWHTCPQPANVSATGSFCVVGLKPSCVRALSGPQLVRFKPRLDCLLLTIRTQSVPGRVTAV